MTENTPNGEGSGAVDMVTVADNLLHFAIEILNERLTVLRAEKKAGDAGAGKAGQEVFQAIKLLVLERSKIEQLRSKIDGAIPENALNLDEAREEVWSRLDSLRRAHGAEGLPGGID